MKKDLLSYDEFIVGIHSIDSLIMNDSSIQASMLEHSAIEDSSMHALIYEYNPIEHSSMHALKLENNAIQNTLFEDPIRITIEQNLMIASIGCVTQEEKVLLAVQEKKALALILAYLYLPKSIMVVSYHYDEREGKLIQAEWSKFHALHPRYMKTTPNFIQKSLNLCKIKNTKYDVIFHSSYDRTTSLQVEYTNRFHMILDKDYESFVEVIKHTKKLLNDQGKLIIFVRACWILPVWQLLEEMKLQLEYQEFHFYFQKESNQNRFVWLRLSYHEKGIELDRQKRNLTQLMEDNTMDRLFAHRNECVYPYHEFIKEPPPAYVSMIQNRCNLQYFFSAETTKRLTELCRGYTACLVVPSIAMCANDSGKNIVLFEMDNRFRASHELKFVKYDLYKGLNQFTERKYGKRFRTVICDPPFNVDLDVLAKDIYELIQDTANSNVYVVYPRKRASLLFNAMQKKSMYVTECELDVVEYSKPPKIVRQEGQDAIKLYKFYVKSKD